MADTLTLEEGLRLLQVSLDKARGMGINVSISVVDGSGIQICAAKMDRAGFLTPEIAFGKAFAAAAFKRTGRELGEQWAPGAPVPTAMIARNGGRFVPSQGSVPIKVGNDVIGAIGASGAKASEDEEVAQAGVDALRR